MPYGDAAAAILDSILATVHEPILVLDGAGRVRSANRAFRLAFPTAEELAGKEASRLTGPPWDVPRFRGALERVLSTGEEVLLALELELPGSGSRSFALSARRAGSDAGAVVVVLEEATEALVAAEAQRLVQDELHRQVRDRTAELTNVTGELRVEALRREEAERRYYQAQKMEAIGRLAGGVAHDFNNMLSVILGTATFIRDSVASDAQLSADVADVIEAGQRAAELTRQLLTFSRQQVVAPRVVDVNALVMNMHKLLRRMVGEDVELVTLPARDLWMTRIDPGRLEQVVANLAVNARDAMPQGGKLTIETRNVVLDASHGVDSPGEYVQLAVSDDGCGMDADTKERAFEPFFTTKDLGKGTGLGLSTCYGIVRQAGGHAWIASEPGHGTTVNVYLPRTAESALDARDEDAAPSYRGDETVLLVEDERAVRAMVGRVLTGLGYTVLAASLPEEALRIATAHGGPIQLLLTDVVMPQMSGPDVAQRLREWHPEVRVLYMSGYTDRAILKEGGIEEGVGFLQKPFMPDQLAWKVRDVLDATRSNAP